MNIEHIQQKGNCLKVWFTHMNQMRYLRLFAAEKGRVDYHLLPIHESFECGILYWGPKPGMWPNVNGEASRKAAAEDALQELFKQDGIQGSYLLEGEWWEGENIPPIPVAA